MKVQYVPKIDVEAALDPEGPLWGNVQAETLAMMGTPVGLQPTDAVRVSWIGKEIGAVKSVEVAAVHDGQTLAFRLEWEDATENRAIAETDLFHDAAGVLFPSVPGAVSMTMGMPGAAVNAWHWRADEDGRGRHLVAEGLGTTREVDVQPVRGRGVWRDGRWRVVLTRPLKVQTTEPVAQLEPGQTTGFGVAVWEGSHRERAGIKAFSGDWIELSLANLPTARR